MKRLILLLSIALLVGNTMACNSERTPEKRGPGEGFAWQSEGAPSQSLTPAEPPPQGAPAPQAAPPTALTAAPQAAPAPAVDKPIEVTPAQKKLVFQDDFDRKDFGPDWKVQGGDWQLKDNTVHSTKALNKCLWLTKQLPDDIVIELEAWSMAPRGDLKFTAFADGNEHETGYTFIMGGWFNTISVIARMDEHGADRKERHHKGSVVPGKHYKFELRRVGGRLDWYVDGQLYMTYEDKAPLRGPGHQHFAFCNWEVPLFFDNLRIYAIEGAKAPSPAAAAPAAPAGPMKLPTRMSPSPTGTTTSLPSGLKLLPAQPGNLPTAPLKLRLPPRTLPIPTPSPAQ